MTPSEDTEARVAFYDVLEASPGMPIHEVLRLARKTLRITTKELAKISGVSERSLRDIASGSGNPSLLTIDKLLSPFGLRMGVVRRKR